MDDNNKIPEDDSCIRKITRRSLCIDPLPMQFYGCLTDYEMIAKIIVTINQLIDKVCALDVELDKIKEEILAIISRLDGHDTEIANIKQELTRLLALITQNQEAIKALQECCETVKNSIETINNELISINNKISTIQGDITEIQGDITKIQSDISSINTTISNIQTAISNINNKISSIETEIANIKTSITNLDNRVTANENNITTIQGDITNLDKRVTTNETNISNNSNAITEINKSITTIQGDIVNIENILSGSGGTGGITADITKLKNDVKNLTTDVINLDTRVEALENALTKVNADIADIYNKLANLPTPTGGSGVMIDITNPGHGLTPCTTTADDNSQNLQKIMEFCADNGYIVYVPSGEFYIKQFGVNKPGKNLYIMGNGITSSKLSGLDNITTNLMTFSYLNQVIINDISIPMYANTYITINFLNVKSVIVDNVSFYQGRHNLVFNGVEKSIVNNCNFTVTADALSTGNFTGCLRYLENETNFTYNIIVNNCFFYNNNNSNNKSVAIEFFRPTKLNNYSVTNCTFNNFNESINDNNAGDRIKRNKLIDHCLFFNNYSPTSIAINVLYAEALYKSPIENFTISNNEFYPYDATAISSIAIYMQGKLWNSIISIENNIIFSSTGIQLEIQNNYNSQCKYVIKNNRFTASIPLSLNYLYNVLIENCHFYYSSNAIHWIIYTNNCYYVNINACTCDIPLTANSQEPLLNLSNSYYFKITNNNFKAGFTCLFLKLTNFNNLTVTNNYISMKESSTQVQQYPAFYIADSAEVNISNNNISAWGSAISVQGSNYIIIKNNFLTVAQGTTEIIEPYPNTNKLFDSNLISTRTN